MKFSKYLCMAALAAVTLGLSSCSDDDKTDEFWWFESNCITFEDFSSTQMANPTSYGDNLYFETTADGTTWPHIYSFSSSKGFYSQFNYAEATAWSEGGYYFYNGGIAVSNWSLREDPASEYEGWWYDYLNQCSVYNTAVESGSANAGHAGSGNFAVVYGWGNDASSDALPWFEFKKNGVAFTAKNVKMFVCNSAYTYGVIVNGNAFASSLVSTNGWFKVQAYGFDASGNITNGGDPVEFYLANYSSTENNGQKVEAVSTWQEWDLSALGSVAKIKFNFKGSDTGAWGLNTPAYCCIDDIYYE